MTRFCCSPRALRAPDLCGNLQSVALTQDQSLVHDVVPTSNWQSNILAFNAHKYQMCALTDTHNNQCRRKPRRTARHCEDITRRGL